MEVPHNYQVTYRKKINTYIRIREAHAAEDNYFDRHTSPVMLNAGPMAIGPIVDEVLARTDQSSMFDRVRPLLESFISGQDVVICCFGNSSTGKTYTMFGPGVGFMQSEATYGILPRAVTYLFPAVEDRGPRNKDNGISLSISACEFFNKNHRDLLTSVDTTNVLTHGSTTKGNRYINNLTVHDCKSASVMMQMVETLMAQRLQNPLDSDSRFFVPNNHGSILVRIQLSQPGTNGSTVVSQALFIELACEVDELPVVDNFTGQVVMCNFNIDLLYLFEALKSPEAWGSNCNQSIRYYPLYGFLEDALKGGAETIAICCLSPSSAQQNISLQYLYAISMVQQHSQTSLLVMANVRPNDSVESSLPPIEHPYHDFSSITLSEENSDKDQTPLKQDGLLERIEEVTESEDEIYSSNENLSKSCDDDDDSQTFSSSDSHNSLSEESDIEEEVERRPCESDENFRIRRDNMYFRFYGVVDSTVNRFKTTPLFNPSKERKNSCSAARRGGVPCVKPQPVPRSDDPAFFNHYELPSPQHTKNVTFATDSERAANELRRERSQLAFRQQTEASVFSLPDDGRNSSRKSDSSKHLDISGSSLLEDGRTRDRKSDQSQLLDEMSERTPDVVERSSLLMEQGEASLKAQIRKLRQLSLIFSEKRAELSKTAKLIYDTEKCSREIVVCDTITTLLDADLEFLNNILLNNEKCLGKAKSPLEERAMSTLRSLNTDELRYCLQVAFSSVIDTQTAARETDAEVLELLGQVYAKDDEILNLRKEMVNLIEENYILKQQLQREQQHSQVVRYTADAACAGRSAPSHPTSIIIRTGTEGRRGPLSIPRQLLSKPTESSHDVKIKDGKVSITKK